jgi:hypothetical protein
MPPVRCRAESSCPAAAAYLPTRALLSPTPSLFLALLKTPPSTFLQSTQALPFGTIVIILLLWGLVTIPLTIVGGILGKNTRAEFSAPCRTNKYPREIPELPWYRSVAPQMLMAGFLPFSAIYIELYYIFASVWGHKVGLLAAQGGAAVVALQLAGAADPAGLGCWRLLACWAWVKSTSWPGTVDD